MNGIMITVAKPTIGLQYIRDLNNIPCGVAIARCWELIDTGSKHAHIIVRNAGANKYGVMVAEWADSPVITAKSLAQ